MTYYKVQEHHAPRSTSGGRTAARLGAVVPGVGRVLGCGAIVTLALVAGACGDDDVASTSSEADRTVRVEMVDIAFEPRSIDASAGETVRFAFRNTGRVPHDAFIGDADAQAEHGQEMREHGTGHGGEPEGAVTVDPGATAEISYTFVEEGETIIGCHQPGHYAAGMRLAVAVA